MTHVRVKGIKRYRSRGRWYVYHRASGKRIEAEYGTPAFFVELAALDRSVLRQAALPGTLGQMLAAYRASPTFGDLASSTQTEYGRLMNLLRPIADMPLIELTPPFVAGLRDRVAKRHGRRQANYLLSVLSVSCEHGREHGMLRENPVKGIRRVRRDRDAPRANRPWSEAERRVVLERAPEQLKVPIALAMFSGLRKGDVLRLSKASIRDGRIWRRTSKTGYEMSIPLHPGLQSILSSAKTHNAITIAATMLRRAAKPACTVLTVTPILDSGSGPNRWRGRPGAGSLPHRDRPVGACGGTNRVPGRQPVGLDSERPSDTAARTGRKGDVGDG